MAMEEVATMTKNDDCPVVSENVFSIFSLPNLKYFSIN